MILTRSGVVVAAVAIKPATVGDCRIGNVLRGNDEESY